MATTDPAIVNPRHQKDTDRHQRGAKERGGHSAMVSMKEAFEKLGKAVVSTTKMTHTTIVVTGVSILDSDLERCILTKMRPLKKSIKKTLFEGFGPLSTFRAKIEMAYALDILTDDIYTELQLMRKIRNAFSHSKVRLSLDEEPIKALFYQLKRPPGITGSYSSQFARCVEIIDDYLEAFLFRMGETDALRLIEKKSLEID